MTQHKKWVFTELVKDPNDPIQLIAYAMYKADKDDHARQCRSARLMSEAEVAGELVSYHDGIAVSSRKLNDYREKAGRMVDGLIINVSEGIDFAYEQNLVKIETAHQKEIKKIKLAHKKELDGVWGKWTSGASKFAAQLTSKPWYISIPKKIGIWLVSGIPGLFATIITSVLIVGGVSLYKTNSLQNVRQVLIKGVDTLVPDHGVDLPMQTEEKKNIAKP